MSVSPLGAEADHTAATNEPSAARETFELARPATLSVTSVTAASADIISATMNLAAKMQSVAKGSQMVIGDVLHKKLSVEWQQMFEKVNLDQFKWNYHNLAEQKPYQLYTVTF